jgi:hypothetical protein
MTYDIWYMAYESLNHPQNIFLIAYLNMEEIPGQVRPMSVNGI